LCGIGIGVEFVRSIRRHPSPSRRAVPVLALTALEQGEIPTEEFDAYFRKPVDPVELCRVIQSAVTRRR
jgi:CheY-like chemotaxis protein